MLKIICSMLALTFAAPLAHAGVDDPNAIIVVCRSKAPGDKTYQIYGDLTDQGLTKVTYIEIDMWNPEVAPIYTKKGTWTIDTAYRPTPKYREFNRYNVRPNTLDQYEIQVLMPTRAKVYALTKEKSEKTKARMVQGEFEAVVRMRDDFHDDIGGQEYLTCGTGWLTFD